jgi:hypothetical protein
MQVSPVNRRSPKCNAQMPFQNEVVVSSATDGTRPAASPRTKCKPQGRQVGVCQHVVGERAQPLECRPTVLRNQSVHLLREYRTPRRRSQIMSLWSLAPEIQERILGLPALSSSAGRWNQ